MNANHDHQREHQFFGYEMDAKLKQLKPKESLKDFIECGGMLLYKTVSNYGFSYRRPFVALVVLAMVFWLIYSPFFCTLEESFNLSLASSVPFAGLSDVNSKRYCASTSNAPGSRSPFQSFSMLLQSAPIFDERACQNKLPAFPPLLNFGSSPSRTWKSDPLLDKTETLEKEDYKTANKVESSH